MKLWLRPPGSAEFIGPLTLDEIGAQIQSGPVTADFEVLEATGQSYAALKRSLEWKPLRDAFPEAVRQPIGPQPLNPGGFPPEMIPQQSSSQSEIARLLRVVISNQQDQLQTLRAIRWAIVGFSIWFIIQFWFLPKLILSLR